MLEPKRFQVWCSVTIRLGPVRDLISFRPLWGMMTPSSYLWVVQLQGHHPQCPEACTAGSRVGAFM